MAGGFCETMYMTPYEFGRRLGIGEQTVREMCAAKKIPGAFRVGDGPRARWRIPLDAEREYVRARQGAVMPPERRVVNLPHDRAAAVAAIGRKLRKKKFDSLRSRMVQDVLQERKACIDVLQELEGIVV